MIKKWMLLLAICLLGVNIMAQEETPEVVELQAGDTRVDEFGIEQVYVPAGCFVMGTTDEQGEYASTLEAPFWARGRISSEKPAHEVCITKGYWIDKYEVTNEAFNAFIKAGGYTNPEFWSEKGLEWLSDQEVNRLSLRCPNDNEATHPKVCVTWYEAEAYAKWRGGSLPTEAQWEFAARGEESLIYPWGNEWDASKANVMDSDGTMPVGSFPEGASWVGALDMAGNAMEWVADWLSADYSTLTEIRDDPTGIRLSAVKIEKGGWWGSNPVVSRSAYRHFEDPPTYQDHHIGFRIVSPVVMDESE
jgi:formylglycine-generating enzyme required for sulfatase activity